MKQFIGGRQQNLHPQHDTQLNLEVLSMPMHLIAMDFIGKFKPSLYWYQYALTVIDILTNYTWCILLFTKEAQMVHTYAVHMFLCLVD